MKPKQRKRLGEILIEDGVITQETLEESLEWQRNNGGLIGQILIQLGYVTEEQIVAVLGRQLRIPYMPLANYGVNMDAVHLLDESVCRKNVLVVFDYDARHIFIALSDPLNSLAVEELRQRTKLKPQVFISSPTEIVNMLDLAFSQRHAGAQKKAG